MKTTTTTGTRYNVTFAAPNGRERTHHHSTLEQAQKAQTFVGGTVTEETVEMENGKLRAARTAQGDKVHIQRNGYGYGLDEYWHSLCGTRSNLGTTWGTLTTLSPEDVTCKKCSSSLAKSQGAK